MTYRGETRNWSNRYFFNTDFTTQAHFNNLADLLVTNEKQIVSAATTFQECIGYEPGSEVPVYTRTASGVGSVSVPTDYPAPGDAAIQVRFSTTQRSTKNHPIYLFKWYHDAYRYGSGSRDDLSHSQKSAVEAWAAALVTGLSLDSNVYKLCGPYGAVAQGYLVNSQIKHRDFRN